MRARLLLILTVVAAANLLASCRSTLDSLGCAERNLDGGSLDGGLALRPLSGPTSYPNLFRDLLGKSDTDIATKIDGVFQQLFHGDASTQAIFVPTGNNQAYIEDVLHNQAPTEGLGLGMMITVSLGKRVEFDQLWRYAKSIQVSSGDAQGYIPSVCIGPSGTTITCYDPYGIQQITMAMLLARGRWQTSIADIDYGQEAASLLGVINRPPPYNCVKTSITSVFDGQSGLPYDQPGPSAPAISHPSFVMPAYYDLWHEVTGDDYWSRAAAAARAYWQLTANPSTGLMPEQEGFDGSLVTTPNNHNIFNTECLRIFFNMALDGIWSGNRAWLTSESNLLLEFFYSKGLTTYAYAYSLDGKSIINSNHDPALVAANGTLALIASDSIAHDFVDQVWNLTVPTGSGRYYPGITQLFALVLLSGAMQVH